MLRSVASVCLLFPLSTLSSQETAPLPYDAVGGADGLLELAPRLDEIAALAERNRVVLGPVPLPSGAQVQLDLERIHYDFTRIGVHVDGEPVSWDPGDLSVWRGAVLGLEGSDVLIAFSSWGSYGWIDDGSTYTHVSATPAAGGDWSRARMRFVSQSLMSRAPERATVCMQERLAAFHPERVASTAGSGNQHQLGAAGVTRECNIAVETDYQLFQHWGSLPAVQNYVMQLLAAISDRYETTIDVVLEYPYLAFYTSSNDPWSSQDTGGDTIDLLYELQAAWGGNVPSGANVGHFLSGAYIGGGVAFVDVLCDPDYNFAVSASVDGGVNFPVQQGSNTWDFVVFSHETGHNFDSYHTHSYCPPIDQCAPQNYFGQCQNQQVCTSSGTVMSYCHLCSGGMDNVTTYFHPQVATIMRDAADACLPTADSDCDMDGIPDQNEDDCDNDGTPDDCQSFADCNANGIPDECDEASGALGTFANYGFGLSGTGGFVPAITFTGCVGVGQQLAIRVTQGLGGAAGVLAMSPNSTTFPFFGGLLLVLPPFNSVVPHVLTGVGPGAGSFTVPTPLNAPAGMAGVTFYAQSGYIDGEAVQRLALTPGLSLTLPTH